MSKKKPNSARSTLEVALTDGICMPVAIISALLVAGTLGAELRGLLSFLMLLDSFVMPIAMLGIGNAIIYFTSSEEHRVERVFWASLLMAMSHGLITAAAFCLLWRQGWLGPNAEKIPEHLAWVVLGISPIRFGNLMLSRIMIGTANYRMLNFKTFTSSVIGGIASVVVVCVFDFGLAGAVITSAVIAAMEFLTALIYSIVMIRPIWGGSIGYLKEVYGYGLKSWLGNLASRANLRIDQVMLAGGPAEALGCYAMATRISELIWVFPDALAGVLFNRIASMKSDAERVRLTAQVHRSLFMFLVPVAILGGLAGFWVIPLILGEDYAMTSYLVAILLPGAVGFVSFKILTKYFGATKQPGLTSLIQLIGFLFGLVCYWVMIWYLGVVGAGIASSLTYIATSATALYFIRKVAPNWKRDFFGPTRSDLVWLVEQFRGVWRRKTSSAQNETTPPSASCS